MYNLIYCNNFIDNSIHAYDFGSNNHWNNSVLGNYWDDYDGEDLNSDGIGDMPYEIPGIAESRDFKPLMNPYIEEQPPNLIIESPEEFQVLQDTITILINAEDQDGVEWVSISIRYPEGEYGEIINEEFEGILAEHICGNEWQIQLDTTLLPDGYYIILVNSSDLYGYTSFLTLNVSIRNWEVLDLLSNMKIEAGRLLPIKFSLRVIEEVDLYTPFVLNEELIVKIYEKGELENILLHEWSCGGRTRKVLE